MKDFKEFIPLLHSKADPVSYGVYPLSVHTIKKTTLFIAKSKEGKVIVSAGPSVNLVGEKIVIEGTEVVIGELNHENAKVLRALFPFTAPKKVLSAARTIGVGDRLGIAGPGHIRVFEKYDAYPVLAQQSVRELTLTNRTFEDVLDAATFAVFQEGYKKGYGADGDHLKTEKEVETALSLGFSMITLDCSEHMHNEFELMNKDELDRTYIRFDELEQKYLNKDFDIGEGLTVSFSEEEFKRMVMTYKDVLEFASFIYDKFFITGSYDADFEISIDETSTPTTPAEHFFIANELIARKVKFATLAPRFCGEFQKGVDYIGDTDQFERELKVHAAIARHFSYKLSLHSGSDKFRIFEIFGRITRGNFHVKTAGTNYLEAMKLVAMKDPAFYRKIHAFALTAFDEVTKYYHVTTDITRIPPVDTLDDQQLVKLFEHNDSRQLIHITYGPILNKKDENGSFVFKDALYALWNTYEQLYSELLFRHIGRHLHQLYRHCQN
ncbi:MAG: tagaturonate epimerase family protein [Sphaerochaetaceae bacterium]|nr:tagaturonate epimerase family protein [Sphaerochaetaceae bacterium]MDC7246817.1 tagaturonate epimerase family protein [Sphaerochaetaceae bacterium]